MAQVVLATPPPPGLQEATKNSTTSWQHDLESLFHHAKDRFPDVVWELVGAEEEDSSVFEEVWGHKAIVYARAPPSFQSRYFTFRANGAVSPAPYSSSPSYPIGDSALSLGLESSINLALERRTPSPAPSTSLAHASASTPGPGTTLLRLTTSINPSLFSDELEYLYTGKGFGEAFEFLFDSADAREGPSPAAGPGPADPEALRIDKLRKDLVFMWRSRLYSDVRIALTGNFGGAHESTTAIFSSHRFILVSRSSYFHTALIGWPMVKTASVVLSNGSGGGGGNNNNNGFEPPTLTLPSPPFTPASLHFTLGFIYTGTLIFSHRTYDLSTAFAILRSALYLSLTTLHDEIQARIIQEMMHGLFHACIPFAAYESLTQGKWGTGGCRCRQCARRAPRVLEFAVEEDVRNGTLERGTRRALVGMFGEGWCTQEFASLAPKLRESLLRGLAKRCTPENVFPLLFAAEHALKKIGNVIEPWGDVVREMIVAGRKSVEEVLARESDQCFEAEEWMEILSNGGVRFEDGERVEWAMGAVMRGVREGCAPGVYQTLVSSILLRPHPTDPSAPLVPSTSQIHVLVEETRLELLKWIAKRWLDVRAQRGFDLLEGWALKEIGDYIEVPIDDLLNPPSYSSNKGLSPSPSAQSLSPSTSSALKRQSHAKSPTTSRQHHGHGHGHSLNHNQLTVQGRQPHHHLRPTSNHPHTSKVDAESDAGSSMRVSVLSRSVAGGSTTSLALAGAGGVRSSRSSFVSSSVSVRTGRERGGDRDSVHSLLSPSSRPPTGSMRSGMGMGTGTARSSAASTHSVSSYASVSTVSAVRPAGAGAGVRNATNNNNTNNAKHASGAGAGEGEGEEYEEGEGEEGEGGGDGEGGGGEKMSPAKRIASQVRAAHALSKRERERPDSKLTPSIVEPEGARESEYLTDEDDGVGEDGVGGGEEELGEGEGGDGEEGGDGDSVRESFVDRESVLDDGEEEEQDLDRGEEEEEEDGEDAGDDTINFSTGREGEGEGEQDVEQEQGQAQGEGEGEGQDDTQSLASDASSVYHTPPVGARRGVQGADAASASGSRRGVRTKTTTAATATGTVNKPRPQAPSVKSQAPSQTPPRKTVISTSSSSIRTSQYSSAVGGSRPSSRGSSYNVTTPRTRVAGGAGSGSRTSPSTAKPPAKSVSRPVSRVSTRSVSGGSARPMSSASSVTDTGSASTYRTAPGPGLGVSVRQRRTSATSTTSTRAAGGRSAAGSPVRVRARRISGASVSSVASNASSVRSAAPGVRARTSTGVTSTPAKRAQAQRVPDPTKLSPAVAASRSAGARASAGGSGPIQASVSGASSSGSIRSPTAVTSVKKLSVGAAGATVASAARSRTLSHKKSTESVRRPGVGAAAASKTREKEREKVEGGEAVPVVPPALADKDKNAGEKEEKENVAPVITPTPTPSATTDDAQPAPPHLENTSSTITIKQKVYADTNEHKKTSSSASSSSVATLRRKGSTDTIRTVKSSGLASVAMSEGPAKPASTDAEPRPKSKELPVQAKNLPSSPPLPPLPLSSPSPSLSSPTPSALPPPKKSALAKQLSSIDSLLAAEAPTGATLAIGIPCIISLKRKRFKAYARYIGEVVGETGPWVGVEVPLPVGGDSWGDAGFGMAGSGFSTHSAGGAGGTGSSASVGADKADDRQWNDGSWGGIRYFEIGGIMGGSEWEYGAEEQRAARRRRIDAGSVGGAVWGAGSLRDTKGLLKREADQLSISSERLKRVRSVSPAVSEMSGTETRGLFVRPQQVLYVVDAVGADL